MNQDFLDLSGINALKLGHAALSAEEFPILRDLSPLSLRILNDSSRTTRVSKGVEMLHEGGAPHDLYFIKQGKVSIVKKDGEQLKVLAQLSKGEVYGEFGILRKKMRYASAYTAETCEIVRVELSAVQQVLDADPSFKAKLNKLRSQRMLETFFSNHLVLKFLPAEIRAQIAKSLPVKFYHRDERLFSQGAKPSGIYLILSGDVEVLFLNRNRDEMLLEIRRDQDLVGELAAKNGTALAYSAVASSDLDILILDQNAMRVIHNHHIETFKKLEKYINARAKRTANRLKESSQ